MSAYREPGLQRPGRRPYRAPKVWRKDRIASLVRFILSRQQTRIVSVDLPLPPFVATDEARFLVPRHFEVPLDWIDAAREHWERLGLYSTASPPGSAFRSYSLVLRRNPQ